MKIFSAALLCFLGLSETQAVIVRDGFDPDKSAKWGANFKSTCFVGAAFADKRGKKASGVLISPDTVLTAAHTVRAGEGVTMSYVIFGSDIDTDTTVSRVSKIIPHPDHGMDHKFFTHGIDLALLKLENPIPTEICSPVKLYEADVKPNQQFYVAGFGETGTSTSGVTGKSGTRHMGTTRITDIEKQHLGYSLTSHTYVEGESPTQFESHSELDPYQVLLIEGDSGGPLLIGKRDNLKLAGIFSGLQAVKIGKGGDGFITQLWTPIKPHRDWILGNL